MKDLNKFSMADLVLAQSWLEEKIEQYAIAYSKDGITMASASSKEGKYITKLDIIKKEIEKRLDI